MGYTDILKFNKHGAEEDTRKKTDPEMDEIAGHRRDPYLITDHYQHDENEIERYY